MADERPGRRRRSSDTVTIKKYANRRLYNTATSKLRDPRHPLRHGAERRGLRRPRREGPATTSPARCSPRSSSSRRPRGRTCCRSASLRQLIQLYGDNVQAFVPRYLEAHHGHLRAQPGRHAHERMNETFGGMFPVDEFEAMAERNMALMQRTMEMFSGIPAGERRAKSRSRKRGRPGAGARCRRRPRQARQDAGPARRPERTQGRKGDDD